MNEYMTPDKVLEKAVELLKLNGYRRSASNVWSVLTDCICLDELDKELHKAPYHFDWDYNQFKTAYDNKYSPKRKKSTKKPVKMVVISVGDLMKETPKAYCFWGGKVKGNSRLSNQDQRIGIWVPKSQVTYNKENSTLEMPQWLAVEKNWMKTN